MRKTFLLLIFISNFSFSQQAVTDSIISSQIKNLLKDESNNYFIIENYCIGCSRLNNLNKAGCNYETSSLYLFSKEKETSYFKEIDKCNSPKVKISNEIFEHYLANIRKIKNEKVEDYKTKKDSVTNDKNYSFRVSAVHSTFTKYYFLVDGEVIVKLFDHFNLTTNDTRPNINYDYNNSLELIKLNKVCDKIIRENN